MTTVGFGDAYPKTAGGKFVGMAAMLTGILLIALPVAIVGRKFQEVYENYDHKKGGGGQSHDDEEYRRDPEGEQAAKGGEKPEPGAGEKEKEPGAEKKEQEGEESTPKKVTIDEGEKDKEKAVRPHHDRDRKKMAKKFQEAKLRGAKEMKSAIAELAILLAEGEKVQIGIHQNAKTQRDIYEHVHDQMRKVVDTIPSVSSSHA